MHNCLPCERNLVGIHNSAKRVSEGRRAPKAGWGWASSGRRHKLERKGERDDRLIYSKSG